MVNAFGNIKVLAENTWMVIKGTDLAPDTGAWQASDFINGRMPTARPVQAGILGPHQRPLRPRIDFLSPLPGKLHLATAGQERPDLLQAPGL
jgi:hypothetical protein